jgi:hypothetical protein
MGAIFGANQPPMDQALSSGDDSGNTPSMSSNDRDLMIRTIYGEAGHEPTEGQVGVANVIKNRLNSGDYGSSIGDVIKAPKQFSLWNKGDPAGVNAMKLTSDDPRYQAIGNLVDGVMGGKIGDNTGGADHYYNPHTANPDWGDKLAAQNDTMIGNHRFVGRARNAGAVQSDNPADLPAVGAHTAQQQFAIPGQQQPAQSDQPQGNIFQRFGQGGLGAVLGLGASSGAYRPFDLGSALTKAGIAAMARDNPQGAAAMAQVPSMEARAWQPRFQNVNYNPTNGQQIVLDSRTGNAAARQVPGAQPYVQMPAEASKRFDDNNTYINQMSTVNLPALRNIQMQLANGEIDPSMLSQGLAKLQIAADNGDQKAHNLVNAEHWIKLVHSEFLQRQEGTQTDKDSEHAYEAIMPGNSEYDSVAMSNAIDNIIKSERAHIGSAKQYQMGALNTYRNQLPFDPNQITSNYDKYDQNLDALDAQWQKARGPFVAAREKATAGSSQAPAKGPKYQGSHSGSPAHAGSIANDGNPMSPEDATKLPSGTLFNTSDGRTLRRP